MPPIHLQPDLTAMWRVETYGQERWPAGSRYYYNNQTRGGGPLSVIQLTTHGSILHHGPRGETVVGLGQVVVFRHGDKSWYGHPTALPQPYACRWLSLKGAGLNEHIGAFIARHGAVHNVTDNHPFMREFQSLRADRHRTPAAEPTTAALKVYALVMRLFDLAEHQLIAGMRPVQQAMEAILRQPFRPWSLKQLSADHGVSREHLSRVFQQRMGVPPHTWLTEARLKRAMALLGETQLPIAEVAEQSGYADTHTLARQVRAATGKSPTAYREHSH